MVRIKHLVLAKLRIPAQSILSFDSDTKLNSFLNYPSEALETNDRISICSTLVEPFGIMLLLAKFHGYPEDLLLMRSCLRYNKASNLRATYAVLLYNS
jgi:hypothetical protein